MKLLLNLTLLIGLLSACGQGANVQSLSAQEFSNSIDSDDNALIIDVRKAQEFNMKHIKGAVNVDFYSKTFKEELNALDKHKNVYVYCLSGNRSAESVKTLSELGFDHVVELQDGLLSWEQAKLPLERSAKKIERELYSVDQFKQIVAEHDLVMVDFMADWCGPCKMMAPSIALLKKEYEKELKILKINVDHNPDLSNEYRVMNLPTLKVYSKGELVHDVVGYQSEAQLRAAIAPYL